MPTTTITAATPERAALEYHAALCNAARAILFAQVTEQPRVALTMLARLATFAEDPDAAREFFALTFPHSWLAGPRRAVIDAADIYCTVRSAT